MKSSFFLLTILLCTMSLSYGQNGVSGYINADLKGEQQVVLSRKSLGDTKTDAKILAAVRVNQDGFFSFEDSLFSSHDEVYNVAVRTLPNSSEADLDTTISSFRSFILSNKDSLFFYKGSADLVNYATSSKADREWQKLKEHERAISAAESPEADHYAQETREYARDSLQILLVKLLSIQTLDDKDLLERDIKENPDYYLDLLLKLRTSELDPASYAHYESKIREVNQDIIQRKYYVSMAFNVAGLLLIIFLGFWLYRVKKKMPQTTLAPLSKQENNIKALIIEGKTNKEIAEELFISTSTVKTHITNIYSKLKVSNRRELIQKD